MSINGMITNHNLLTSVKSEPNIYKERYNLTVPRKEKRLDEIQKNIVELGIIIYESYLKKDLSESKLKELKGEVLLLVKYCLHENSEIRNTATRTLKILYDVDEVGWKRARKLLEWGAMRVVEGFDPMFHSPFYIKSSREYNPPEIICRLVCANLKAQNMPYEKKGMLAPSYIWMAIHKYEGYIKESDLEKEQERVIKEVKVVPAPNPVSSANDWRKRLSLEINSEGMFVEKVYSDNNSETTSSIDMEKELSKQEVEKVVSPKKPKNIEFEQKIWLPDENDFAILDYETFKDTALCWIDKSVYYLKDYFSDGKIGKLTIRKEYLYHSANVKICDKLVSGTDEMPLVASNYKRLWGDTLLKERSFKVWNPDTTEMFRYTTEIISVEKEECPLKDNSVKRRIKKKFGLYG